MSSVYDLAELGRLWEEHRPRLLAMLERRLDPSLRARVGAEDVLSEAFLVAQRRWPEFRKGSPMTPYAWLYRLALDALIEAWRREHRDCRDQHREMPYPDRTSIQMGLNILSPGTKPSQAFARQQLREQVRQALELMPEQQRKILWMRHVDELSIAEISSILEVHERTVYRELRRPVKQLTEIWQRFHPDGDER